MFIYFKANVAIWLNITIYYYLLLSWLSAKLDRPVSFSIIFLHHGMCNSAPSSRACNRTATIAACTLARVSL